VSRHSRCVCSEGRGGELPFALHVSRRKVVAARVTDIQLLRHNVLLARVTDHREGAHVHVARFVPMLSFRDLARDGNLWFTWSLSLTVLLFNPHVLPSSPVITYSLFSFVSFVKQPVALSVCPVFAPSLSFATAADGPNAIIKPSAPVKIAVEYFIPLMCTLIWFDIVDLNITPFHIRPSHRITDYSVTYHT
jgi:hypothetical protein